ncbi:MAG TPA: branched-chain amino acid aminotransferase [Flavisolibacter sp.]|nr:branched-chain amino acid aminotransferase [Flavisolibacter sp.]
METLNEIQIQPTLNSRLKNVDWNHLEFGKYVSDHMFLSTYKKGDWLEPQVIPFQNLSLAPTTLALHYGQSVFEGMKAFRMQDGGINIFRIEKHHDRLNRSLDRMCIPEIPFQLFNDALHELVKLDKDWVPSQTDSALYLRPIVFASEARFGVKISEEYKFIIVTGPSPMLYPKPIKVKVERHFIRAAKGGTGYAKCAGNYGGAFYPTKKANEEGFDQVIWTDAFEHEYFEESGTMNLMFVIDGTLITPPLSDTILDGVTRDSLLMIANELGIPVEERPIGITEFVKAFSQGKATEAFGAGTAAVIAPISSMGIDGKVYELPAYTGHSVQQRLKNELEAIRTGAKEDVWKWNSVIQ